MKKIRRPRTPDAETQSAQSTLASSDRTRDLELLLARTSAALEKATRQLQERTAEFIRMESECKLSAERYYALINNIPGVVYRCANDEAWTMQFMSNQITELSGFPAEEFINNAVRTYASIIHPEDVLHVFRKVQDGLERRKPYVIEYRIRHKDGSIRFVWEKGQGVFNHEDELNYLDGVIFDVTDRIGSFGFEENA
jgi:PAS domain S-box-containing protein